MSRITQRTTLPEGAYAHFYSLDIGRAVVRDLTHHCNKAYVIRPTAPDSTCRDYVARCQLTVDVIGDVIGATCIDNPINCLRCK